MKMLNSKSWILGLGLLATFGCSDSDDNLVVDPIIPTVNDKYFIAASQGDGTYMMTVNDLEKDTIITTANGIENPLSYTHYAYNGTSTVLAINYQQGNPAPGAIYQLDANGKLVKMDEFELSSSFSTIGAFGDYIVTSKSGRTLASGQTGASLYFIDLKNNNYITEKTLVTENFYRGKTAELLGIVDAGNGEFLTGINLAGSTHDSVFVARLDANLNIKKIYEDDRLSYSGGQMKSARYSQIANDTEGNTYVFSGAYSATTTKNAGALLIKKGSDNFDASYYFDIEKASGGYRFRKVWHITEDYFLLECYNAVGAPGSSSAATQYGVVKMSTKDFKWVSGIPAKDNISNTGWPFTSNGKAYIPVTAADAQPAVYNLDPKSGVAKKGITVSGVNSIPGLARLTPQK
jgi:hypothetical protein